MRSAVSPSATAFDQVFGFPAAASATAPGRVNLLGEHTDYNDGFVLPTAIPQRTRAEVAPSRDGHHAFHASDLGETVRFAPGEAPPPGFARYVHGCIEMLRSTGTDVPPLAVSIHSDVPIGAGLSSSAALEVAVLRALRTLLAAPLDDVAIAQLAQQAEVRYAGVRCGIMDQMASSLADAGHMLFLDTRTLERRLLPLPSRAAIVVIDSGVPRRLADSGYNRRREECEAAARALGVASLRDLGAEAGCDPSALAAVARLPAPLDRRARHVLTENARVLEAAAGADAARFGALMNASHASLRDDYEVSVPALDTLVALLQAQPGVHGARLTGAGFGGACVALVDPANVAGAVADVLETYAAAGFRGRLLA